MKFDSSFQYLLIVALVAFSSAVVLDVHINKYSSELVHSSAYSAEQFSVTEVNKNHVDAVQVNLNKVYGLTNDLLAAFSQNTDQKAAVGAVQPTQTLETISKQRKEAVQELIRSNPQIFFAIKMKKEDRAKFPLAVQANIEKEVTLEGETEVLHFDDFKNPKNSRNEYYLKTSAGKIRLYPTSPLHFISGTKIRLTGYQVDTMLAYDSSADNLQIMTAPRTAAALGDQKILVLLLDETLDPNTRPLTNSQAYDLIFNGQIQKYYKEQSYNKLSLGGNVYGWFRKDSGGQFTDQDIEVLIKNNNIDLSQYGGIAEIINTERVVGGFASVGKSLQIFNGISYRLSRLWMDARLFLVIDPSRNFKWTSFDGVFVHEFGHNLGLMHANGLDCENQTYDNCTNVEYGNSYDAMSAGGYYSLHFNSALKNELGWLGPRLLPITESGRYTISPLESTAGFAGANISNPFVAGTPLFVEYRKGIGFDESLNRSELSSNQQGLFINRFAPSVSSELLDMTPTSADWYTDILSTTLNPGQGVFTDPKRGITIGPVVSSTPTSITFDVVITTSTCVRAAPEIKYIGPARPPVKAGDTTYSYLEVTNKDSAACASSIFAVKPALPYGWELIGLSGNNATVVPGTSAKVSAAIKIPLTTPSGAYVTNYEVTNLSSGMKSSVEDPIKVEGRSEVIVTSLTPSSGPSDTRVTILGSGFSKTGNTVLFVPTVTPGTLACTGAKETTLNESSSDSTSINIIAPAIEPCTYAIFVSNSQGIKSNSSVPFTLLAPVGVKLSPAKDHYFSSVSGAVSITLDEISKAGFIASPNFAFRTDEVLTFAKSPPYESDSPVAHYFKVGSLWYKGSESAPVAVNPNTAISNYFIIRKNANGVPSTLTLSNRVKYYGMTDPQGVPRPWGTFCDPSSSDLTVRLTEPLAGTSYIAPANIPLAAQTTSCGGSVTRVEFYSNNLKVSEDTTSPYQGTLKSSSAVSYILKAVAYDDKGAKVSSESVTVKVSLP